MAQLAVTNRNKGFGETFNHVGTGIRNIYQTANAANANGDTFDVPYLVEEVLPVTPATATFAIARNSPGIGGSRITITGATVGQPVKCEVIGRP